ncbi:hypothetical protein BJV78DRAFT_562129 [Lactifluus subvellereus]|nr:hypothetical protein BJV78DRAFT_562129 [Lactifluus subvellereus]
MQDSVNPFASDATQRVPLTYENLKLLERECFVTKEGHKVLLIFCAGATIPTPLEFAYEYTHELLMNVQTALRELLGRKLEDITVLDRDALMSARKLEEALIKDPNLPEDDETKFLFKMCNSGERRLLRRTWREQCDFVMEILKAFVDEGFENS